MRAHRPVVSVCAALCALAWAGCSAGGGGNEVIKTDQAAATSGAGYCRSTTCQAPQEFPQGGLCEPSDWPQACGAAGRKDVPLWWRSGCMGWSLQKDGGHHVSFDDALVALQAGFEAWTARVCPTNGAGPSHPSIDARYLGAVSCGALGYNQVASNQNVIVFRDDGWPHKDPGDTLGTGNGISPTIALTTVTFDQNTGEIYDADMELNSGQHNIVPLAATDVPDDNTFDLESVVTHEIGHIFGVAHAPSRLSVMFASDEGHDLRKRTIAFEDIAAICAIYPPDGTRSVDVSVSPTGHVTGTACDPTPRHGFTSDCQSDPPKSGCSVSSRGGEASPFGVACAAAALTLLAARRRRREPL